MYALLLGLKDKTKSCVLFCIRKGGEGGILQALTKQSPPSWMDERGSCGRQTSLPWLQALHATDMAAHGVLPVYMPAQHMEPALSPCLYWMTVQCHLLIRVQ